MNKAIILSVKPEHAYNILSGKKTLELRKSAPKGFKGWVYVYVTKAIKDYRKDFYYQPKNKKVIFRLHGVIPFRFWFDEYDEITYDYMCDVSGGGVPLDSGSYEYYITCGQLDSLQLSYEDVLDYGKNKDLYAWHIKNLEIFDKPMELGEFMKDWDIFDTDSNGKYVGKYIQPIKFVTKPPQSYMYAWVKEEGK